MPGPTLDWFVAAGAKSGDGSRERPFHDPWLALFHAGPGDVIHVAAGVYFGRYDRSSWVVDSPRLTIRGGYSRDFSTRTPWQTPSVFAVFPDYESVRENNLMTGHSDHSGLVLDGLFFDSAGSNTYGNKPGDGISGFPTMAGEIVSFNAGEVTIRNCVFANGANGGIELAGDGSRFENNLVINIIGTGMLNLRSASGGSKKPILVAGNTFCFAHDLGEPCGVGADSAIGVRAHCPAVVQDNVFVSCGNAAIEVFGDVDRTSIDRNLFYLTPHDLVTSRAGGNTAGITEKNLDELEDLGLKSAAENAVLDPGMTGLKPEWLDAYSRHLLSHYATPPRETANALRTAAGLAALTRADLEKPENQGALAPRFAPAEALALRFAAKQGFHPVELAPEIGEQAAAETATYRAIDWNAIDNPDPSLANQRVELRAGLGFEQNTTLLPDALPETHMGIRIYRPNSDDGSIFVLAGRYTFSSRQYEKAIKYTNGREAESTYLVRGIYRMDIEPSSRQKVTLVVESIVPAPLVPAQPGPRPEGRDWFVKAGSSGGDGTREKPFRDPFQALEKAEGGDAIHVAGGDYFGKLHSGQWKILIRNLTLLGGYNAEFTERDPWKNPTRLLLGPDEKAKGTPEGRILASEENSDGLVLDGFIFDGAAYNTYTVGGSLNLNASPVNPLVALRGGRAPITVRNCIFLNASDAAVNIDCPYGVFENNLVLNSSGWALKVRADGPGPWIVRDNSLLFACDPTPRAGTGKSSSDGTLFHLAGRAIAAVECNVIAFADNFGVRFSIPQQNVSFQNNVFAANLFNHLTDEQYLWADSATWERRAVADSDFAAFQGNTLELPKLPVDPEFADAAIQRLSALPSRISGEQWKSLAGRIGASAAIAVPSSAPVTPAPPKPASASTSSLSDLLMSLGSVKEQIKQAETPKTAAAAELKYCPAFDWKKTLLLVQEASDAGPGAHKRKLDLSFSAPQGAKPQVQYTQISAQQIDAGPAALDNMAVELEVRETRSSSANPSLFPAGTTTDDYAAYSVTLAGDAARTRIAIIVRLDTATSKLLDRITATDTLRIRGIARATPDPNALSIVVDNAQREEP
jgi:hypothetical protein